ncbi:MAG: class I SAM-dependent methyltransferase [Chromatiales bacterium]|jgi:SAM-dependent methyltransferase
MWDLRHGDPTRRPEAAAVLTQNRHLLPPQGLALDLACGLGGNALLLAESGLRVSAWDLSPVAVERLRNRVLEQGLANLQAEVRNVEERPPAAESFDVIVVTHYLERRLVPALVAALKPGGLLFYQTFTQIAVSNRGPENPVFRLADNELLRLFKDLAIRFYREENRLGNLREGHRDVAMLVAERPGTRCKP